MKEIISTYAPGVTEVFAAVDVNEKTKSVEFESVKYASKTPLTGLKEQENSYVNEGESLEC